jgi:Sec-independent protein translocase protein TatA
VTEVPVADGVTLPAWLAILLLVLVVVGPIVSGVVASVLTYRAATKTVTASERATATTRATEQDKQAHEVSKSNRELILQAIGWTRDADELTATQGWAMLDGLSRMPGLSPDDAVLILSVTRPAIERRLSEARRVIEIDQDEPAFVQDIGPREPRPAIEGGGDDQDDQGVG